MCSATVVGRCGTVLRRCDATRLPAQENLDGSGGDPRLDLVADKAKRDTVVVLGDLYMVVEIDATALPFRVLVGLLRQRQQGLTIELFEELTAAASPATEVAIIEIDQEAPDRLIEGGKREEAAFLSRARIQRPTICTPTSTLDLSFG
jgi:hypothetical protein